jgi:hypothetical protein
MNIPYIKFFALMQIPSALILIGTFLDIRAKRRMGRKIDKSIAEINGLISKALLK